MFGRDVDEEVGGVGGVGGVDGEVFGYVELCWNVSRCMEVLESGECE